MYIQYTYIHTHIHTHTLSFLPIACTMLTLHREKMIDYYLKQTISQIYDTKTTKYLPKYIGPSLGTEHQFD